MKKIKLTIPNYYYYKLLDDAEKFYLSHNNLYNMIFYNTDILSLIDFTLKLKPKENKQFYFNLNKKEEVRYSKLDDEKYNILNNNSLVKLTEMQKRNLSRILETDAKFFKTIFLNYLSKESSADREKFLFMDNYKTLRTSAREKKKVKVSYKNTTRVIEPYFIKDEENYSNNYVYSYCYKNKGYVTFLLSRIKKIEVLEETWENYNEKDIKSKKVNFVRYETENKIEDILIKLNNYGLERLKKESSNRPNNYKKVRKNEFNDIKLKYPDLKEIKLKENEYLYEFKTSTMKVEFYFPQFLDNFEVLHPQSLRNYFKEKFERALKNHKQFK